MKKIIGILIMACVFMAGCTTISRAETEISSLQAEVTTLKSENNYLEKISKTKN